MYVFGLDNVHELTSSTVNTEQMTALYNFGQFQYTYSNYSGAADYLYHFQVLFTDNNLNTSAVWAPMPKLILRR
jgi:translation initiation factor 3 subunit E